jgi:lysophospholipase L1-like esterase
MKKFLCSLNVCGVLRGLSEFLQSEAKSFLREVLKISHIDEMINFSPIVLASRQFASVALFTLGMMQVAKAEIAVKTGDKIAFLGDSITAGGWGSPTGYVRLVISGLDANGVKAEPLPAGIGGHKSNDMLGRLDRDVLSKKPQWMTLSCGVNDVWHGRNGVALDDAALTGGSYGPEAAGRGTYQKNILAIVEKAQAAGVQVVILTATVIQEKLDNAENAKLAPYNDYLLALAKEKKVRIADLNGLFQERIKAENKPGQKVLTGDGVHMAPAGDRLMAVGVLQAFGLDAAQMKTAEAAWTKAAEAIAAAKKVQDEIKATAAAAKAAAAKDLAEKAAAAKEAAAKAEPVSQ